MRLDKIDLNLFIVFEVIYREGNLTKSATVLNITQPAVSNALARLRKTFDDPLFERQADGMKPTTFAQNLIGPVREALWVLNNGVIDTDSFNPETAKRLVRISMSDLSSALILSKLIPTLNRLAPGIVLEVQTINQDIVIDELSSSNLEFCVEAPILVDQRLYHTPLFNDSFVCVVRNGHPAIGKKFTLENYLSLEHIHTSSRKTGAGHIDAALHSLGHKRKIKTRLQNYLVAPTLVMATDMALTIPRRLAQKYDLTIIELPFKVQDMGLHLYWHKAKDADPGHKWLRELILDCCDTQMPLDMMQVASVQPYTSAF